MLGALTQQFDEQTLHAGDARTPYRAAGQEQLRASAGDPGADGRHIYSGDRQRRADGSGGARRERPHRQPRRHCRRHQRDDRRVSAAGRRRDVHGRSIGKDPLQSLCLDAGTRGSSTRAAGSAQRTGSAISHRPRQQRLLRRHPRRLGRRQRPGTRSDVPRLCSAYPARRGSCQGCPIRSWQRGAPWPRAWACALDMRLGSHACRIGDRRRSRLPVCKRKNGCAHCAAAVATTIDQLTCRAGLRRRSSSRLSRASSPSSSKRRG